MYKGREFPVCAGIVTWVFFLHSPPPCCHTPSQYTYFTLNTHTHAQASLQYSATAWSFDSSRRVDKRLRRTCAAAADANAHANARAHARWPWPSIRASSGQSRRERRRAKAVERDAHAASRMAKLVAKCSKSRRRRSQVEVLPPNSKRRPIKLIHTHKHACMYAHVFI